jgi:hypothetical protein
MFIPYYRRAEKGYLTIYEMDLISVSVSKKNLSAMCDTVKAKI